MTLLGTNITSLANNEGLFQIPGVALQPGQNTFTVSARNGAGEVAETSVIIEKLPESAQTDPVLVWNGQALEAARKDAATPTFASRAYAMVHTAIFDVVAAIDQSPGFLVAMNAAPEISLEAAIAGAGERVLNPRGLAPAINRELRKSIGQIGRLGLYA